MRKPGQLIWVKGLRCRITKHSGSCKGPCTDCKIAYGNISLPCEKNYRCATELPRDCYPKPCPRKPVKLKLIW